MGETLTAKLPRSTTPINRTARAVISGGYQYQPKRSDEGEQWFDVCPLLLSPTREQSLNPEFVDLTGQRYGYLTVIGYAGKGRWACKCICGRYALRKAKAIKQKRDSGFRPNSCSVCNNTARIRDGLGSYMRAY